MAIFPPIPGVASQNTPYSFKTRFEKREGQAIPKSSSARRRNARLASPWRSHLGLPGAGGYTPTELTTEGRRVTPRTRKAKVFPDQVGPLFELCVPKCRNLGRKLTFAENGKETPEKELFRVFKGFLKRRQSRLDAKG